MRAKRRWILVTAIVASITPAVARAAEELPTAQTEPNAPPSPAPAVPVVPNDAAVIDFGGFLGVGSRKIVVDWNALHFGKIANKKDNISLELTKAQVAAAPEYKEDTPIVVLGASGSLQPLQVIP